MPHMIDWEAIRADYVSGGISQRALAKKYGVAGKAISKHSVAEGWVTQREEENDKRTAEILRETRARTAEAAADNAVIAARIRTKLLLRLERILDSVADDDGTLFRESVGEAGEGSFKNKTTERKLKDIADVWKVVAGDLSGAESNNELLESLLQLEREARHDQVEPETS